MRSLITLIVTAASAAALQAQTIPVPPIQYDTFTLANGLLFIVHSDHSTPVVAVDVWYDVGSAHEAAGRSGFAHLFEHMLFQETRNMQKGDFDKLISNAGGSANGTTNNDRTFYYETVPSNQINRVLWMEAERMANLRVSKENFEREREVVKEERRMRIENQPYMTGLLTLDTAHTDYRPYRHTVIGSMDDLNAATVEDVLSFYKQYYVPNNATIVLAGDITVAQAKQLAQEFFADIPRGAEPPALPPFPTVPRRDGERRTTVEDPLANTPLFMAGYNVPPHSHDDTYALSLLSAILSDGESSRLNQRLVKDEKAAVFAGSGLDSRFGPGMLAFQALPNQGVDLDRIEKLINEEIEKIRTGGVTEQELQKVKTGLVAGAVMGRQQVLSKAEALQHARFMHGDLSSVNTDLLRYQQVTAQDIKNVAERYLVPANRTVVRVVPGARKPVS